MQIRSYKKSNYQQLKRLLTECGLFDRSYDTKKKLGRKRPKGSILVAIDSGKLIGCIFYTYDGWDSSIYRLAVAKKHRSKGIGTRLLEEAEKRLKRRGVDVVSLRVHVKNKRALEFLRKRGYYGNWGPYWDLEKKL